MVKVENFFSRSPEIHILSLGSLAQFPQKINNRNYVPDNEECSDERYNRCHPLAKCTDTKTSHICTCPSGYVGDGKNCQRKFGYFGLETDKNSLHFKVENHHFQG